MDMIILNSFEKSVVAHGRLDESRLALESAGIFNLPRLLDLIPVGLRALIKGKLPPLFPHKAEDNKKLKILLRKLRRWNNEVCILSRMRC